jgi:hypothetical protein
MAIGDQAAARGLPLVPDDGEEGRVALGAQEINRTRDMVAQTMNSVPTGKAGFRTAAGISSGTADPTGGNDGDIYFKIVG